MSYKEKLRKASDLLFKGRVFDFDLASIWPYSKYSTFDSLIEDQTADEQLAQDVVSHDNFIRTGNTQRALSKFNSENARKVIEYYSLPGDTILDPFAGRTRYQIAEALDRKYIGFEINPEYVFSDTVINDDSLNIGNYDVPEADLVFTCPPYWNMEVYSKDIDGDLSRTESYESFLDGLHERLERSIDRLKDDGFLVIVLMDFRRGNIYRPWHIDTTQWITSNTDLKLYDTIIWELSPAKRHPLFPQAMYWNRMLATHEYCLVFNRKTGPEMRERLDARLDRLEKSSRTMARTFFDL